MERVAGAPDDAVAALLDAARRNEQSAPRKHHLIPASYLTRWGTKDRIRVTETIGKHSYTPNPSTAARETDFYRLESDDIDPDEVPPLLLETALSGVEGRGKPRITQLITAGPGSLNLEEAMDMAVYLAFQMTRGRSVRTQIEDATDQMVRLMLTRTTNDDIESRLRMQGRKPTPEVVAATREALDRFQRGEFVAHPQQAQSAILAAQMAGEIAFYLVGRAWRVYTSVLPLITCDDPVVPLGGLRRDSRWQPGAATAPVFIFPLDPHHLLAMFHPGMDLDPISMIPALQPTEAHEVNLALAANSDRWLFEQPHGLQTLKLLVPPWTEQRSTTDRIKVVNEPEGEYYRNTRPTRWQPPFRFPGWPIERWWAAARKMGLHDVPYDWRLLPRPMYDAFG